MSGGTVGATLRKLAADVPKPPTMPQAPQAPPAPAFPTAWRVPTDQKAQQELHLWNQWKQSGEQPEHLETLLSSLQPLIHNRLRVFQGRVPIKKEVLHAQATDIVVKGLRKFDPSRSQMKTLLTNELRSMQRYVMQHQNLSRITEDRAKKVGQFQRAGAELAETLGRPATAQEVADHMKVSVKTVTRLSLELREDLLASGSMEDPFLEETPRSREVLQLLPFELTPTEMQVFEYLTGYGGKPKVTQPGQIAKRLGWSGSKVSQVKNAIAQKAKKYL